MKAIGLFLLGLSLTISTSSAQPVYSANVVGYHTRDVPTGGICTLSNPLNGTNNQFNTVLRLPAWADGTMVTRQDVFYGEVGGPDKLLAEITFELKKPTTNLEYRLYVNKGVRVILERINLESADS